MKVLGLIPARGGSKGVPGKNIRELCGRPLLEYTAESALAASRLDRVILSTDSEQIADVGRKCGLEVPFLRPAELAEDNTPTLPVVQHVLTKLSDKGDDFDAVCLLQPTNPLRRSGDIDKCIGLLESNRDADSVVSVLRIPDEYNPHWAFLRDSKGTLNLFSGAEDPITRRQDLPETFHRDGSVYVTRTATVLEDGSLYGRQTLGFASDPEFSINIDTEEDWSDAVSRISGSK